MDNHDVARTPRAPRTPAQRQAEQEKIASYRALDARLLELNASATSFADPQTLALTADVLVRNPEHYTAWNARRRCLTCGSLSRPSHGPSPSAQLLKSSAPSTASTSSAALSASSSAATPPDLKSQAQGRSGKNGTIAESHEGQETADASDTQNEATDAEKERQAKALETLKSELMFTLPLIKAHPKCYWIWNHRLWVLKQTIFVLPLPAARRIWEEELGLVAMMLNKDQRNFHAWGYRRHVVSKLESHELAGSSMAESELAYTKRMIEAGLSNFSAWHYRGKIIPVVLAERGASDAERRAFLESEYALVRRTLDVGPEDQSCWYYHQFLVDNMIEPLGKGTIAPNLEAEVKVEIVNREIVNILELLEDYDEDFKLAYEALIDDTMAIARVQNREVTADEKEKLRGWLAKLRQLDPKRKGRWNDFEREHQLA